MRPRVSTPDINCSLDIYTLIITACIEEMEALVMSNPLPTWVDNLRNFLTLRSQGPYDHEDDAEYDRYSHRRPQETDPDVVPLRADRAEFAGVTIVRAEPVGNLRETAYDLRPIWFERVGRMRELRRSIAGLECACPMANASYANMLLHAPTLLRAVRDVL